MDFITRLQGLPPEICLSMFIALFIVRVSLYLTRNLPRSLSARRVTVASGQHSEMSEDRDDASGSSAEQVGRDRCADST